VTTPRKLIGLGLICFICFAVVSCPARVPFLLVDSSLVNAAGVRDTLWSGSAAKIDVAGIVLSNTQWNLALSRLLLGELGGDIKTRWDGGFASGFVTSSVLGTIRANNVDVNLQAAWVAGIAGMPGLEGQVNIVLDSLTVTEQWPSELVGAVKIANLSSTLLGSGAAGQLGNIKVDFDPAEDNSDVITGIISDEGGPLELNGTLVLTRPNNYSIDVQLKTRPSASEILRQNMILLGSPDSNGAHTFQLAGSF
jgi:general secretion pathway protein N